MNYIIYFLDKKNIPTVEDIINTMQMHTGLKLRYNKAHASIECLNNNMSVHISCYMNSYQTYSFAAELDYLSASLLFTLRSLGGNVSVELPDWAGLKWMCIKNNFDDLGFICF